MATIERTYNIPLRREFMKAPPYRRSKKAITALKQFLTRHMHSENIRLGPFLNMHVWERGIQNPPHHVKVAVIKEEDGVVTAELVGKPMPLRKEAEKEKGIAEKLKEKVGMGEKKVVPKEIKDKNAVDKKSTAQEKAITDGPAGTLPKAEKKQKPNPEPKMGMHAPKKMPRNEDIE